MAEPNFPTRSRNRRRHDPVQRAISDRARRRGAGRVKEMAPIIVKQPYQIDYIHSFGQDSPFFAGLANGRLLGSMEPATGYTYANPRGHDMYTGEETDWVDLTRRRDSPCVHRVLLRLGGVPTGVSLRAGADRVRGRGYALPGPAGGRGPECAGARLDRDEGGTALPPQQQVQADGCVFLSVGGGKGIDEGDSYRVTSGNYTASRRRDRSRDHPLALVPRHTWMTAMLTCW